MTKVKKDESLKAAGAYDEVTKHERWNAVTAVLAILFVVVTLPFVRPLDDLIRPITDPETTFSEGIERASTYFSHIAALSPGSDKYAVEYNVHGTRENGPDVEPGDIEVWSARALERTGMLRAERAGRIEVRDFGPIDFARMHFVDWIISAVTKRKMLPPGLLIWLASAITVPVAGVSMNPHRKTPNIYGDTRYAGDADLKRMEKDNKVGFDKDLFVVGRWRDKLLKMGETLSVLLLAPPGTGKTAGFVVPSIVTMDNACMFVHDQKPELFDMTSNHRASLGPVLQFKWSAQDAPDGKELGPEEEKAFPPALLLTDDDGNVVRNPVNGHAKTKAVYHPSWNVLSPRSIPPAGPRRDMYIDRIVNVLAPDPNNGDKFWTSRGRAALSGLVHFLVGKIEAAEDDDIRGGRGWEGIPSHWVGREPSFPMLVDWFTEAQTAGDDSESEDPMRDALQAVVDEAYDLNEAFLEARGVPVMQRAIQELVQLKQQPDRTRGSILTTMDEALGPFKNEAVRQRTSASDFSFAELRGRPTAEAREREEKRAAEARENGRFHEPRYAPDEMEPITIYISVAQEDARALAPITGIFVDAANSYLIANPPGSRDDQGRRLGPYAFTFMLDEAPQLPKLDTVINGPSVGRGQKVSYVIVGQDYGQFEQKYSKQEVETLKSTTSIKVILSQNNEHTAKAVSEAAGKTTFVSESYSEEKKEGAIGGIVKEMTKSKKKKPTSESFSQTEFLKPSFLMSLPKGKHIVLVQDYMNRPIFCETPRFFEDEELSAKVFNQRTLSGPKPAPPMPLDLMEVAEVRHRENERRFMEARGKTPRASGAEEEPRGPKDTDENLGAPTGDEPDRHVLVATPRDIRDLSRDAQGNPAADTDLWACVATELPERAAYVDVPEDGEIFVTNDVREVVQMIGRSTVVMFDRERLDVDLNETAEKAGADRVPAAQLLSMSEYAESLNDSPGEDLHDMGYHGGACLDPPEEPDKVTPQFAVYWMTNCMSHLLGIADQKRLFDEAAGKL